MANNCFFLANITGKESDVKEVIKTFKTHYDYDEGKPDHKHLQRIFNADEEMWGEEIIGKDGEKYVSYAINGQCAWSVYSCMMQGECTYYDDLKKRFPDTFMGTNLEELSRDTNTVIEVYSEELGCEFQEHYLVKYGEIIIDEERKYREVSLDFIDEGYNTVLEYIKSFDDDEIIDSLEELLNENKTDFDTGENYIGIGGFEEWHFNRCEKEIASNAKPKIYITVEGGIVTNILSTTDVEVALVDYDAEGADEDEIITQEEFNSFTGNSIFKHINVSVSGVSDKDMPVKTIQE